MCHSHLRFESWFSGKLMLQSAGQSEHRKTQMIPARVNNDRIHRSFCHWTLKRQQRARGAKRQYARARSIFQTSPA